MWRLGRITYNLRTASCTPTSDGYKIFDKIAEKRDNILLKIDPMMLPAETSTFGINHQAYRIWVLQSTLENL